MTTIGTPIMFNMFTDNPYVDTIFGTINLALAAGITMTLTFLPFGSGVELIMHNEYKNSLRNENGINGDKYYKYYQDGKLDKKLEKYYSDTGIQLAKEYIEEKGPSLVLRRK